MKIDSSNRLPEALVGRLDPVRFQQYLRVSGWKLEPRLGKGTTAVFERPESRLAQIRIPLTHELTDFADLMRLAVAVLASWEKRPALEVLNELQWPPSDVLRFCESGSAAENGSLPFDHGFALLAGVRKTLLAAACHVCRPQYFHPRLTCDEAERFLSQCRLGQTESGSFVVTVACPLDPDPGSEMPFARRLTLLLMRTLDRLASATELDMAKTDSPVEKGEAEFSVNLCEGIMDMSPAGEGSALTVSVLWERTLPLPAGAPPQSVELRRETFDRIAALSAWLRRNEGRRRQEIIGFVDTLAGRVYADHGRAGTIVLLAATSEGEICRVQADLDAADYAEAATAHLNNMPVMFQGVLYRGMHLHRVSDVSDFRICQMAVAHTRSADGDKESA